ATARSGGGRSLRARPRGEPRLARGPRCRGSPRSRARCPRLSRPRLGGSMPTAVRDVMTTDVVSFTREQSVTGAMQRLLASGVSGGPVVDGDNKVVGMLTDSDLIVQDAQLHAPTAIAILGVVVALPGSKREFEEDLHKQLGLTVGEVMGEDPVTIA